MTMHRRTPEHSAPRHGTRLAVTTTALTLALSLASCTGPAEEAAAPDGAGSASGSDAGPTADSAAEPTAPDGAPRPSEDEAADGGDSDGDTSDSGSDDGSTQPSASVSASPELTPSQEPPADEDHPYAPVVNGEVFLRDFVKTNPGAFAFDPETETVTMELRDSGPKGMDVTPEEGVEYRMVVLCRFPEEEPTTLYRTGEDGEPVEVAGTDPDSCDQDVVVEGLEPGVETHLESDSADGLYSVLTIIERRGA